MNSKIGRRASDIPSSSAAQREKMLDEALAETFPASDPIAVSFEQSPNPSNKGLAHQGEIFSPRGLKLIRLELDRPRASPFTDWHHSYVFQAFLSADGQLESEGYSAISPVCKVMKFAPDNGPQEGQLLHTPDGWVFSCACGDGHHIEVNRLGSDIFIVRSNVTIIEDDGVARTFRVVFIEDAPMTIAHSFR